MSTQIQTPTISYAAADPWRHYHLKQRATSWVSQHIFDHMVYTVRHGLLKGMKRKGGLGWLPESMCGSLLTPEIGFWQSAPLEKRVIYDIGAFHGMLTLFFARRGSQVVAYEPVGLNRSRLAENVKLNSLTNVTIRDVAVGAAAGTGVMQVDLLMSGGSKLGPIGLAPGGMTDSVESIQVTTLDQDIRDFRLPDPEFIKIDVEGCELQALQGAAETLRRCRPELFLEMHGDTFEAKVRKTREIVEFLFDSGYRDVTHVESGTHITPANSNSAARGHLYCHATPKRVPLAA